jgi:hypothetical protein
MVCGSLLFISGIPTHRFPVLWFFFTPNPEFPDLLLLIPWFFTPNFMVPYNICSLHCLVPCGWSILPNVWFLGSRLYTNMFPYTLLKLPVTLVAYYLVPGSLNLTAWFPNIEKETKEYGTREPCSGDPVSNYLWNQAGWGRGIADQRTMELVISE